MHGSLLEERGFKHRVYFRYPGLNQGGFRLDVDSLGETLVFNLTKKAQFSSEETFL